jgi:hypothetical protein
VQSGDHPMTVCFVSRSGSLDVDSEIPGLVNVLEKVTPPKFSIRVFGSVHLGEPSQGEEKLPPRRINDLDSGEVVGNHGFWGAILPFHDVRYLIDFIYVCCERVRLDRPVYL